MLGSLTASWTLGSNKNTKGQSTHLKKCFKATGKGTQQLIGSCCVCLHVAKSLTGFKLCATTPNNTWQHGSRVCKQTQHTTSNNVAPVCTGLKVAWAGIVLLDGLVCSIVGYFYKSHILTSLKCESKYKRRVKISHDTTH